MTHEIFKAQVKRLIQRFGEKNFDPEFVMLVWRECHSMSETAFVRFCDVLIGSRTANKPPLLSDFREARLAEEKIKFENDVRGAARAFERGTGKNLRDILRKEFGAVNSVAEALEIAKLRLRTRGEG